MALSHPAFWLAALAAAASIVVSVSFRLYEKDIWQHLAVGRALWTLRHVPTLQLWVWPTYGTPNVTPSWLFRALIWPVWEHAGVAGLFAWRWCTTLVVFALSWATARRMGARGVTPLVVMALCALSYRQRSQVRPETLASVLLAIELFVLETRRRGGRDLTWGLVPLAWVWANSHVSFPLGFAIGAIYVVTARLESRRGRGEGLDPARLLGVLAVSAAVTLLHPGGFAALREPFEFMLAGRDEAIMRTIPELQPLPWRANLADLLPLLLGGWLLLAARRTLRHETDIAELSVLAMFLALALSSQRFLGFAMVAIAPFLARDLDAWVAARRWPAWTSPAWSRAGAAAAACAFAGIAEWSRPALPLGLGLDTRQLPVHACDFMVAHGVRGRGFNPFYFGGYQLYRFWPERERLPFMDIHQSGTRADRDRYARLPGNGEDWRSLDALHRFDYVLWKRTGYGSESMLDMFDADTNFALVFMDDAAALFVRRSGATASLADSLAYRLIPAGTAGWAQLGPAAARDPSLRARIARELEREAGGSLEHALAESRLGNAAFAFGDLPGARTHLERALTADPRTPKAHELLGEVALAESRPRDAVREFEAERAIGGTTLALEMRLGSAWRRLGDVARARTHWQHVLKQDSGFTAAADSLASLQAAGR